MTSRIALALLLALPLLVGGARGTGGVWPEGAAVGDLVEESAGALRCALEPAKEVFHVGDRPALRVAIVNGGEAEIYLAGAVGGAEFVRRPRLFFTVEGPPLEREIEGGCGQVVPIHPGDLVALAPGESFDPYMTTLSHWFFPSQTLTRSRFGSAGRYVFTFHYDSDEPRPGEWKHDDDPEVVRRLRRLPRARLSCSATVVVE